MRLQFNTRLCLYNFAIQYKIVLVQLWTAIKGLNILHVFGMMSFTPRPQPPLVFDFLVDQ